VAAGQKPPPNAAQIDGLPCQSEPPQVRRHSLVTGLTALAYRYYYLERPYGQMNQRECLNAGVDPASSRHVAERLGPLQAGAAALPVQRSCSGEGDGTPLASKGMPATVTEPRSAGTVPVGRDCHGCTVPGAAVAADKSGRTRRSRGQARLLLRSPLHDDS
jgi:hypothetical protein